MWQELKRKAVFTYEWLRGKRTRHVEPSEYEKLCLEIDSARQEWTVAHRHLNCVSDAELIDHSIYHLEAAERKYTYLLREAKKRYAAERAKQVETGA